jgi:hypothetical protein
VIFTVAIAGVSPDPEIYGGLLAAVAYIGAKFGPQAAAWMALSPNARGQTLVTATRYVDQQSWSGAATGLVGSEPTTLQFPRSQLTRNDEPVDAATVPPEVPQAVFELAILIAAKPTVVDQPDTSTNLRSVSGGGGVGAAFFHPTSTRDGSATLMPTVVQRLLGRFLAAANAGDDSFGQGANATSQFGRSHDLRRSEPF